MVYSFQLMMSYRFILINESPHFIQISFIFYLISFICFRIPCRIHYIHLHDSWISLQTVTVSRTSLVIVPDDLNNLRSVGQMFCRTPLKLGSSDVFLIIRLWVEARVSLSSSSLRATAGPAHILGDSNELPSGIEERGRARRQALFS